MSSAQALADKHGGVWGEHPKYPIDDWQYDVMCDYTRRGYWEWVLARLEAD